jgi:diguanylate cyclase (GGDEF)-like protein/PAS domain S-box-containing protein
MDLEKMKKIKINESRTIPLEVMRKDGTTVWTEVKFSFIRDKNQQPVGILGVTRDITERRQAEGVLLESEKYFKEITENSSDIIVITDKNGKIKYCSRSIERFTGYTPEELIGRDVLTVIHMDDVERARSDYGKAILSMDSAIPNLFRIVRKDGAERYFEGLGKNLLGNPAVAGFIMNVRDITERKQAEAKLRQQTDAMDAAIDGMAILNAEGEYVYLNKAHVKVYGYDNVGELIGKSWRILYDSDVIQYFDQEIMPEFSRNGDWHGETIGTKKNGSKFSQELSLTAMADGGLICVVRDITNRKQSEQECQLSEERFKRIFDEGPFGMGLESPNHTIIAANKVLCELLGYTEQELTGKNVTDITCEDDRVKSKELLGQLFANNIPVIRLEKRYIKKNGDILWANTTISAVHGQEGNVLYGLAIIEDLTESRKSADKIHQLAYYDSLTGLPNLTFHKELMKRAIEHAQRHKETFAVIYVGLDNFQRINDTLGHSTGDILLKAVADRITNSLRKSDHVAKLDKGEIVNIVFRVGGDEFIVLAHDLNQAQDAAKMSQRLLAEMSAPYDLTGREVFLTVSIGISLYPDDGADVDDLLKNAEKAMRHTKNEGKNNYHFYSSSMHSSVLAVLTMESDLHKALERNELVLYYQPKVDAATRMVKGMEALIRWIHPDKGLIPPLQFIPLAEKSGLIIPIGEFVIRTVCRQIKTWQEAGYKQMAVSLNVSGIQFDRQNLIEIIKDALQDTMIPSQCLELEITESVLMRNPEKAIRILTELEAMGIGILIDDFGTGYSSLSYLKRLPALDFLKIDQSFVKSLASDPRDQAIVRATIAMAHSLNLKTIAEGVETQEQLSFLQEHGCDEIQGYLFSRPLPAEDIPGILAKGYL